MTNAVSNISVYYAKHTYTNDLPLLPYTVYHYCEQQGGFVPLRSVFIYLYIDILYKCETRQGFTNDNYYTSPL